MRDGVLFTDARYASEDPEGDWLFRAAADNVGYRDQRYFANYQRTGRFSVTGLWDEIPQFYSVDTATAYTDSGDNLVLDDATQQPIQNGQANLSSWIPLSPQFELHERRDIGDVQLQWRRRSRSSTHRHLHDESARGRVAVGRELRIRQRRRSAAAVRLARPTTSPSARSGRTAATC